MVAQKIIEKTKSGGNIWGLEVGEVEYGTI